MVDFPILSPSNEGGSDAPVVRAPGLDCLLDVRPGKFFMERRSASLGTFRIGGETEGDQLSFAQLRDAGAQRLRA